MVFAWAHMKVATRKTKLETSKLKHTTISKHLFVNKTSTVIGVQNWNGKLESDPSCSPCDAVLNKMIQSKL